MNVHVSNNVSYPLSENQKGLWTLQKTNSELVAYNCPALIELESKIDQEKIRQAATMFVEKHPIFKSNFIVDGSEPKQFIQVDCAPEVIFFDISGITDGEVQNTIAASTRIPFDIENGPLLRVTLFSSSDDFHWLLLETHHLVCDGNSFYNILEDYFNIYLSLVEGTSIDVAPLEGNYKEFVNDELDYLNSDKAHKNLEYWRETLDGLTQANGFTPDKPKPAALTYSGSTHMCQLGDADYERIVGFAAENRVTVPTLFMSAFKLLLKNNLGQNDITIGLPTAGRNESTTGQIGYYANMVPIRTKIEPDQLRSKFLKNVQSNMLKGVMKPYPFSALVKNLNIKTSNSAYPIFCHSFVFQGYEAFGATTEFLNSLKPTLNASLVKDVQQMGEYEFELEVVQRESSYDLTFKYNPDLFKEATIKRLASQYTLILQKMLQPEDVAISNYHCLVSEDIQQLDEWNNTGKTYGDIHLLHEIIDQQVYKTPDQIAVSMDNVSLTYKELWDYTEALAAQMQNFDVKKGDIIGICMSRSVELSVGLLAILRCGAAYVPLDAELPSERLEFIANDCGAQMVLCQEDTNNLIAGVSALTVSRSSLDIWKADEELTFSRTSVMPEDVAYVIYTSGSTGLPKGCAVSHKAICNRIIWMHDEFPITEKDVVLQKTPYSFDVSVWELFWPLMVGSKIEYAHPGGHREPLYLADLIVKKGITVCHFVPSMLNVFVESYRKTHKLSMKYIFTSGEALTYAQMKNAQSVSTATIANLYGPTEAAVDVSYWVAEDREDKKVPIGKPIANVQLHVLNESFQQCPIGVPGQLYISGVCLADGYVNCAELTAERFIDSPELGIRIYNTGDIGRWLADGNIEYLGRNDHQVKIRGFRIELGEIEQKISWHPEVTNVVVDVLQQGGDSALVAYYTKLEFSELTEDHLRDYLSLKLPDYMVPSFFVELESIPTSYSGKTDRKALPDPRELLSATEIEAPADDVEQKLFDIWTNILEFDQFGTTQDFFDLGGNSLSSLMMLLKVEEDFSPRSVSQEAFYRNPTIKGLAGELSRASVAVVDTSLIRTLTVSKPVDDPAITVICCPYAGASITAFSDFAEELTDIRPNWNVLGFRVPGNEVGDKAYSESIVNLASIAASEIVNTVKGKVVLYGHCVGSSIALELAHQLEERNIEVVAMVAGGAFPFPKVFTKLPISDPWQMISDTQIRKLMRKWGGPAEEIEPRILAFMLKNFRKDAKAAFLYQKRHAPSRKLSCPIVSIVSKDDPLTKRFGASLPRWKIHSPSVRLIAIEDGKHYFVTTRPKQLATIFSSVFNNTDNCVPKDMDISNWNPTQQDSYLSEGVAMKRFKDKNVKNVFDAYSKTYRDPLLRLRELVFEVAKETVGVGELDETLKWGEPSYVTAQSGSGSTVRMDRFDDDSVALFFNCRTTLVENFRLIFGDELSYSKNRALVFDVSKPLPEFEIKQCIEMALSYHMSKRRSA